MNRLQNKIAIITGAASGQGAAEAKLFAAEGARRRADGHQCARRCSASPLRSAAMPGS